MVVGVKCPKCGLMQLARPSCKSCGTPLGSPSPPPRDGKWSRAGLDSSEGRRLSFHGSGGTLFGIQIVNVLLTLLTLGVYYFWGKVKVRGYLLSESEFEGDRFAYHGTGKELLTGFLKAVLLFGVPVTFLQVVVPLLIEWPPLEVVVDLLSYLFVLLVIPIAMVGARRYRLSRTSWRGIRFSFRGDVKTFVKLFLVGSLLSTLTLGLYYPFFETRRYGFMVSHSYIGSQKFNFDGEGRALFGRFLLTLLLTPLTLGLCWLWFLARKQRYFWGHTSSGKARFHSEVTGGRLFWLYLGNGLLLLFTLGLGWPWVVVRNVRFTFRYLRLEGPLDETSIQQEAQDASATGEGLAGLLDTGFDLGA